MVKLQILRIPADEPSEETEYFFGTYHYFGIGVDVIFDGSCGRVVLNSNYDVVGQIGFQQEGGDELCYWPSFHELRKLGYS